MNRLRPLTGLTRSLCREWVSRPSSYDGEDKHGEPSTRHFSVWIRRSTPGSSSEVRVESNNSVGLCRCVDSLPGPSNRIPVTSEVGTETG